jgi:hypothetical protein
MDLLWLAVLIVTLYFLVLDEHAYVALFIVLSFLVRRKTNNPLYFLLLPLLITLASFYARHHFQETFGTNCGTPSSCSRYARTVQARINASNRVNAELKKIENKVDADIAQATKGINSRESIRDTTIQFIETAKY